MNTVTEQMKLKINYDFFKNFGFEKVTVDLILRERANSIVSFSNKDRVIFPKTFHEFTPLGNPPKFMAGYGFDDNKAYLSIFKTDDTAIQLSATTDKNLLNSNPFSLINSVRVAFNETLINSKNVHGDYSVKFSKIQTKFNLDQLKQLNNFDSIIFSLLSRRKIVLLGPIDDGINLMETLYKIIPNQFKNEFGFSINLPFINHPSIVLSLLDPELDRDIESKLDVFLENEADIINLKEKECYGQYTSSFAQQILDVILNNQEMDKAHEIVDEIIKLVDVVNEDETSIDLGNRLGIKYDDADLIVLMKNQKSNINGGRI